MIMSLHGAKGERDLKQRVWNILTVKICGREDPSPVGALLNSVCLSSDPQKGSAPWKSWHFPSLPPVFPSGYELVLLGHAQVTS